MLSTYWCHNSRRRSAERWRLCRRTRRRRRHGDKLHVYSETEERPPVHRHRTRRHLTRCSVAIRLLSAPFHISQPTIASLHCSSTQAQWLCTIRETFVFIFSQNSVTSLQRSDTAGWVTGRDLGSSYVLHYQFPKVFWEPGRTWSDLGKTGPLNNNEK